VLVGPQYPSPLQLANSLASLDYLSGGRLTVGIGIGWSRREYEALGGHFESRGARLDEMIRLFRTVWENDPADF
jgi:alkanesulfonate monooxygenase SsuD/methylene tetrahydromethanopterin reductase-like flavin-dependent oxidoreductase (luciferase family)